MYYKCVNITLVLNPYNASRTRKLDPVLVASKIKLFKGPNLLIIIYYKGGILSVEKELVYCH